MTSAELMRYPRSSKSLLGEMLQMRSSAFRWPLNVSGGREAFRSKPRPPRIEKPFWALGVALPPVPQALAGESNRVLR